jgi:hypothetical protein
MAFHPRSASRIPEAAGFNLNVVVCHQGYSSLPEPTPQPLEIASRS